MVIRPTEESCLRKWICQLTQGKICQLAQGKNAKKSGSWTFLLSQVKARAEFCTSAGKALSLIFLLGVSRITENISSINKQDIQHRSVTVWSPFKTSFNPTFTVHFLVCLAGSHRGSKSVSVVLSTKSVFQIQKAALVRKNIARLSSWMRYRCDMLWHISVPSKRLTLITVSLSVCTSKFFCLLLGDFAFFYYFF